MNIEWDGYDWYCEPKDLIRDMIGKTFTSVDHGSDVMTFIANDGTVFHFWHEQNCCESVAIEDIIGDTQDLIGSPMLMAEVVDASNEPAITGPYDYTPDSFTWTFYKFGTAKGYVTVRWYGTSNGYYSERVSLRTGKVDRTAMPQ